MRSPHRILLAIGFALASCTRSTGVLLQSPDTYSISARSSPILGGAAKAKELVLSEANELCQQKAAPLIPVTETESADPLAKSHINTRYTLIFRCGGPPSSGIAAAPIVATPPSSEIPAVNKSTETVSSARSVPMQRRGGTYVVPVLINNAITLDFIVDSGAADVSIPADVVLTLMRAGTIRKTDFLGNETYVLADGSKMPSPTFTIRSLKVGDQILENVKGDVASVKGSLLLGQSFLSRFKAWSIDNTNHALMLE